jgi:hypothetical protein
MAYRSDGESEAADTDQNLTPGWFLDLVRAVAPIGLDPFGHSESLVRAKREYRITLGENAYLRRWCEDIDVARYIVFANPPYSKPNLDLCLDKFIEESRCGVEIVGLYPSDTSTGWFRRLVATATAIHFPTRITFIVPGSDGKRGSPPFPSLVPYYGNHLQDFVDAFEDAGPIWRLREAA